MVFKALDKRLHGTRDNLADVCDELEIDIPKVSLLNNCQCIECGIWGNKRSEMYDSETCNFCHNIDTLRF